MKKVSKIGLDISVNTYRQIYKWCNKLESNFISVS